MDRHDDPAIDGEVLLYRRIPPWPDNTQWDAQGKPKPSAFNFKDKDDELSVHIAAETTPDKMLLGHPDFGLVQFTARQIRECCGNSVIICRCPDDPTDGHVLICGKITGGARKKIQQAARWVEDKYPTRHPTFPADTAANDRNEMSPGMGDAKAPNPNVNIVGKITSVLRRGLKNLTGWFRAWKPPNN